MAFGSVAFLVLLKNTGEGVFTQLEQLQVPADIRPQTLGVELGWPFPVVSTEAFTLNWMWFDPKISSIRRLLEMLANVVCSASVVVGAGTVLSDLIVRHRLKFTISTLLATTASFAGVLVWTRSLYWHTNGIGAISRATFCFIDAGTLAAVVMTWCFIFNVIGKSCGRSTTNGKEAIRPD
jgi:hypothetical protein